MPTNTTFNKQNICYHCENEDYCVENGIECQAINLLKDLVVERIDCAIDDLEKTRTAIEKGAW